MMVHGKLQIEDKMCIQKLCVHRLGLMR